VLKRVPAPDEIRGAALSSDGRLITWGDKLRAWTIPELDSQVLASAQFSEGGCLVDLDGDGRQEFIGKEGKGLGKLTWRKPPDWIPVVIDDEFDTHDCLEATLFGRKGVLVIQRHMQVRFYERAPSSPWPHREIYSIYTPSRQTGLALRDIDGDGRTDIVCGNYWIRSPERFDLPWHIFAINTWFEDPDSAMLSHAFRNGELFMAQAHVPDARAAFFSQPADPRKLWTENRLELQLHRAHAAATADDVVLLGENNGAASRTFAIRDGKPEQLLLGVDSLAILPAGQGILSAGPEEVVFWRYRRR
jgi:hypothetical protein